MAHAHLRSRRKVLCLTYGVNDGALQWGLFALGRRRPPPGCPQGCFPACCSAGNIRSDIYAHFSFRTTQVLQRVGSTSVPPFLACLPHFSSVCFCLPGAHCMGWVALLPPQPPLDPRTAAPPSDARFVCPSISTRLCCSTFPLSLEINAPSWGAILL